MPENTFVVESSQDRAEQTLAQIRQTSIQFRSIAVIDESSEAELRAHPESEELRNAINGSIVGLVIGLLYGAATLSVIGARFIPGIFGASLILGYSGLGGVLFGAIIGSTGIFARNKKY